MTMKSATATLLATTALSFGLAGVSHNAMAKPSYLQGYEHAEQKESKQCHYMKHHKSKKHYAHNPAYRYLKRMTKQLNLTEQQIADIKDIYKQAHIEHQENKQYTAAKPHLQLTDLDPGAADYLLKEQEIAQLRAQQAEQRVLEHAQIFTQVHAILTPEQKAKAAEIRAKKAQKKQHTPSIEPSS